MDDNQRIVVTGMGVISPLGNDIETFHLALAQGQSGISDADFAWETGYKTVQMGRVVDFELKDYTFTAAIMGRASQFALAASIEAMENAELELPLKQPGRTGFVVGTALGDADEFENDWLNESTGKQQAGNVLGLGRIRERQGRTA